MRIIGEDFAYNENQFNTITFTATLIIWVRTQTNLILEFSSNRDWIVKNWKYKWLTESKQKWKYNIHTWITIFAIQYNTIHTMMNENYIEMNIFVLLASTLHILKK